MKNTELRIGNWVNIESHEQTIDLNIHFDFSEGAWYVDDMHIDLVDPIPLTEEWLVKFGFESCQHPHDISWEFNGIEIHKHGDKFPFAMRGTEECCHLTMFTAHCTKYVHQLQNLYFALTGEEL